MKRSLIYGAIFVFGMACGGWLVHAQTSPPTTHNQHKGMNHDQSAQAKPEEAGQGAFAAIQEVVRMLEKREGTDWSQVNIDALRKHLIDMHELTLNTNVKRVSGKNSVTFEITGTDRTKGAVRRMVPRHAKMTLKNMKNWTIQTKSSEDGFRLTIQTKDSSTLEKVRALGFYGIMAKGANHPKHHMMIATGKMDY
ncbi:MAG: hypothetical protein ABEK50_12560 [bacterium]